ncbi:hypothetical protein C8039_17595 [Halogeometricum sp. wsp3]|nr:hypothetical protein C8039_17595 [Halogeometricum sp. wsp3]
MALGLLALSMAVVWTFGFLGLAGIPFYADDHRRPAAVAGGGYRLRDTRRQPLPRGQRDRTRSKAMRSRQTNCLSRSSS